MAGTFAGMGKPFKIAGSYRVAPRRYRPARHVRSVKKARTRASRSLGHPEIVGLALLLFAAILWGPEWIDGRMSPTASFGERNAPSERVAFGKCHIGGGYNCVVDGDTIWLKGEKIRLLDIDTPETHPPRCAEEARLGTAATGRLHALLNGGAVSVERDGADRYGRTLAVVMVDGRPVGDALIAEGLAREYGRGRRNWC